MGFIPAKMKGAKGKAMREVMGADKMRNEAEKSTLSLQRGC